MFSSYEKNEKTVMILLDGRPEKVPEGVSAAAAVLGTGEKHIRVSPVTGEPRSPFCLMGVCYECLMEIDGEKDRQSCQVEVKEGMKINRQMQMDGEGQ
ncbi:MAG: (2Fe-2S)-binding protein [Desulfobacula sp.]|jgi:predicted molibdopterin-dependent oxidoreductase YjgC|nr:(2Fe-2S)-binding protein [Desulfobacula sp.]